jgi:hypothetical protein
VTADRAQIRTLVIGALGCNLAWGVIDAGMYLMAGLHERGRGILAMRAARAADPAAARRIIADALPPLVGRTLSAEHLESIRQRSCVALRSGAAPGLSMVAVGGVLASVATALGG